MKKTTMALCGIMLAMSLLTVGCAKKYADIEKANNEFIELIEDYTADVEKVENARDAARAVNAFADGMEDLIPKFQKLGEKYPELDDEASMPEELAELVAKTDAASQKMMASMRKVTNYMRDPEVMKAQERLDAIMSEQ